MLASPIQPSAHAYFVSASLPLPLCFMFLLCSWPPIPIASQLCPFYCWYLCNDMASQVCTLCTTCSKCMPSKNAVGSSKNWHKDACAPTPALAHIGAVTSICRTWAATSVKLIKMQNLLRIGSTVSPHILAVARVTDSSVNVLEGTLPVDSQCAVAPPLKHFVCWWAWLGAFSW